MTREVDNTAWKKKLTPQQKAEYKAEKREEMQNLFKKINDGVKAVFESDSYKKCLRYMKVNAAEESFELMELFGKTVLFTNMRVDRSTVPKDLYVYEVRDEDCTGEICEIKPFVMVNHWGTIICKEPFEMDEVWHSKFVDKGDYWYLGDTAKLDEFINTDYSEEQSEGMEMT